MRSSVILFIVAGFIAGCAQSPKQQDAPGLQASLRAPCQEPSQPADGSRSTVLRWAVELLGMYQECKSKHARTVEAFPK